jgi:probable HAF family extracellular repeat protein
MKAIKYGKLGTLLALGLMVLAPAAQAQINSNAYTESLLPPSSGWRSTYPMAMNDKGHVVGALLNYPPLTYSGFFWSAETGTIDIGASMGQSIQWAYAVNNHDQVAVAIDGTDSALWSPTSGTVKIPGMSVPLGINDAGMVAGRNDQGNAVIWSASGGMVTINSAVSAATGINNSGQVVGWYGNNYWGPAEAFFWSKATGFIDIGPGFAGDTSRSIAINDNGLVVGWYNNQGDCVDVFVWSKATGRKDLHLGLPPGPLAGEQDNYVPQAAVNNQGQAMGVWEDSGADAHAFLWRQATGTIDLPLTVTPFNGYPAYGLNNLGQIYTPPTYTSRDGYVVYPFSLQITPGQVKAGLPATGVVRIPLAGASDITVKLSSSNKGVTVPATVTIPAGKTKATFPITTAANTANDLVTISTKYNDWPFSQKLLISPVVKSLSLSPSTVIAGGSTTGTVTLRSKAVADSPVTLSSASKDATVPATVIIPAGATSATFPVTTAATVASDESVTIKASSGGASATGSLVIQAVKVASVTFSPAGVTSGAKTTATVTLNHTASVDVPIALTGQSSVASFPSSVTIPAGSSSATFTVKGGAVTSETQVPIQATSGLNGTFSTGMLTVDPATAFTMSLNPWTVKSGKTSVLTVSLMLAAPSGGLTVSLAASDPSVATFANPTLTVPAGQTTGTATITAGKVSTSTTVTVSATVGSTAHTVKLTVSP